MCAEQDDTDAFVAITAMSGRFPGAGDVESFWDDLCQGRESVSVIGGPAPGGYVPCYGALDGPDLFDAGHFGWSCDDALVTDPQHRLLLECAHEALEAAGHGGPGRPSTGVFVGGSVTGHADRVRAWGRDRTPPVSETRIQHANDLDFLATRTAYTLGLTGPAMTVQSACSSSLVAVHVAIGALLAGDCAMALAGGAAVTGEVPELRHDPDGIFTDDGHCRPFDARGRGTVRAGAVGVVVLRPLADALADGDHVHAVVRGTAVANDGRDKMGFAAPSVSGTAAAVRAAHLTAGVDAGEIGYVEAHGTGTPLGDPVEVAGLTRGFRASTDRTGYCRIGSVKSNIGHADAAAGIVGLIKTALCVERGILPATLHFTEPNPAIELVSSPFVVNDRTVGWDCGDRPRIAAVNATGAGGTTAHAVLAQPPVPPPTTPGRAEQLLVVSARTGSALAVAVERLAGHLERHPGLDLADVAWTLQAGRAAHPVRRHVVASSVAGAVSALRSGPAPTGGPGASEGAARPGRMRRPRTVFAFADPGAEPVTGSVAALYRTDGTFRDLLDELDVARRGHGGDDLHRLLLDGPGAPGAPLPVDALVAVQYATARLLISCGVRPAVVTGTGAGARTALALATTSSGAEAARVLFGEDPGGTGTAGGPRADLPEYRETGPALDDTPEAAVVHIGPGRPAGQPGRPPADVLDHPGAPATGVRSLLDVVGRIWSAGAPADLAALHRDARRRRLRLPTYPFERRSYLVPHGPRPSTRTPIATHTEGERLP